MKITSSGHINKVAIYTVLVLTHNVNVCNFFFSWYCHHCELLEAKNAREAWEREFNVLYIQPVLADLDNKVNEAMDLITKDDKQGEHLYYM